MLHAHGQAHRRGRARRPQVSTASTLEGCRAESGVELRHHLTANHRARHLAVPLRGSQCLEPKGGGLGCCSARGSNHCSGSGQHGLSERAGQQRTKAAVDPATRQRHAMRAATLESRLEELGVLRSFSRLRVSNDNPYLESMFRTVKYRPDFPNRSFANQEEACLWVASFVDWYNHRHGHNGDAQEICRHRAVVYERARQRNPRRWSGSSRCWRQPEEVWINPPAAEDKFTPATFAMAARTAGGASSFLTVNVGEQGR